MTVMDPTSAAIDAVGVARRFDTNWVLRGVSLRVAAGEVVGLLGANGTGKSTFLRIVATLLRPHAGSVRVFGHDAAGAPDAVRALVGYMAHAPGVYADLTARENLMFVASMLDRDSREVDGVLARVGLSDVADQTARGFSSGMQRRLAIGRLLLVCPRLLLLDEPYSNLDADGISLMNSVIAERVGDGAAALVVVHELAPAKPVLDRTETLVDGRLAVVEGANEKTVISLVANNR
jgi:heme exporter protein A